MFITLEEQTGFFTLVTKLTLFPKMSPRHAHKLELFSMPFSSF